MFTLGDRVKHQDGTTGTVHLNLEEGRTSVRLDNGKYEVWERGVTAPDRGALEFVQEEPMKVDEITPEWIEEVRWKTESYAKRLGIGDAVSRALEEAAGLWPAEKIYKVTVESANGDSIPCSATELAIRLQAALGTKEFDITVEEIVE